MPKEKEDKKEDADLSDRMPKGLARIGGIDLGSLVENLQFSGEELKLDKLDLLQFLKDADLFKHFNETEIEQLISEWHKTQDSHVLDVALEAKGIKSPFESPSFSLEDIESFAGLASNKKLK